MALPVANPSEPDWALLLNDALDIAAARDSWLIVTAELRAAGRWTPANAHAVERLCIAYCLYDRAAREVLEHGAITRAAKTKVPQYSLHFTVLGNMDGVATRLEAELMISPRKRGKTPFKAAKATGSGAIEL